MKPIPTVPGPGGPRIKWFSMHAVIEARAEEFAREFKSSRPKPRNRSMGFRDEERTRNPFTR
jgi:hypothetical protein